MNYKNLKLIILGLVIAGCGDELPIVDETAQLAGAVTGESKSNRGAPGKDGLSCEVVSEDTVSKIICENGTEAVIADGKDGKNGKDGLDGEDGTDGDQGIAGLDGTDGEDGLDGSDGEDGVNGTDGEDGADGVLGLPMLIDDNDFEIGRVMYMTSAGYWGVLMAGGLRAEITTLGHTEPIKTYFSGVGCTGERRALLANGTFGNFGPDRIANDGTYWVISSNNLGAFTYASKEDSDGICDEITGTIASNTYSITTGNDLGFTVPFNNWPSIRYED